MTIKYNTKKNEEGIVSVEILISDELVALLYQNESGILILNQKVELNTVTISIILNDFVNSNHSIAISKIRFEYDL